MYSCGGKSSTYSFQTISQSVCDEWFSLQGCLQSTAISNCPGLRVCVQVCVTLSVHLSNLPYVLHHWARRGEGGASQTYGCMHEYLGIQVGASFKKDVRLWINFPYMQIHVARERSLDGSFARVTSRTFIFKSKKKALISRFPSSTAHARISPR